MEKNGKQITGGPHYQISNCGEVFSLRKNRTISQSKTNSGHLTVDLTENGVGKRFYVHRLVAQEFIPNPNNLPIVNHKDENPSNNSVENLEGCTKQYNNVYGTRLQRMRENVSGSKNHFFGKHHTNESKQMMKQKKYKKVIVDEKIEFNSLQECAKYFNTQPSTISKILTNKRKQFPNHVIRYK